jgi:hypothetical protein
MRPEAQARSKCCWQILLAEFFNRIGQKRKQQRALHGVNLPVDKRWKLGDFENID